MKKNQNKDSYTLAKADIELLAELKVNNQYIKQDIAHILECLESIDNKMQLHDRKLWSNGDRLERMQGKLEELEDKFKRSTLAYFIKNNWWKVGGFILAASSIFGFIGDILYRLPPPK